MHSCLPIDFQREEKREKKHIRRKFLDEFLTILLAPGVAGMRNDERRQPTSGYDFAEEMALTGREGVDPRNVWTFHVDVDCPNVRYYCFMGFVPYVGFTYFYSAYMGQTKLGMHHLQHKWWAPALIAISITYTSLLCAVVCRCWLS